MVGTSLVVDLMSMDSLDWVLKLLMNLKYSKLRLKQMKSLLAQISLLFKTIIKYLGVVIIKMESSV